MTDTAKLRVAVIEPGYPNYEPEKEILAEFNPEFDIIPGDAPMSEKIARTRQVDALMVREATVNKELLDNMERCRIVVRYGTGVDNIDQNAARERRIYVAKVPRFCTEEVSDHTLALMMSVWRWIVRRDREVREGAWGVGNRDKIYAFNQFSLGLVGFGAIAQRFLEKVKPLGFREVLACATSRTPEELAGFGVRKVELDELCRSAGVISLLVPAAPETHHIIGEAQFALMAPETILINTGRGALVDEPALVRALETGKIRGAGIDVFEKEPPGRDNPLFRMDNVVVTDHMAWYSENSIMQLQIQAAKEVHRVISGKEPDCWINPW